MIKSVFAYQCLCDVLSCEPFACAATKEWFLLSGGTVCAVCLPDGSLGRTPECRLLTPQR